MFRRFLTKPFLRKKNLRKKKTVTRVAVAELPLEKQIQRESKIPSTVTELDREKIDGWFNKHVSYQTESRLTLHEAHNHYKDYVTKDNFVPIPKRPFSPVLKEILQRPLDKGKVKINSHSKLTFIGIAIKE